MYLILHFRSSYRWPVLGLIQRLHSLWSLEITFLWSPRFFSLWSFSVDLWIWPQNLSSLWLTAMLAEKRVEASSSLSEVHGLIRVLNLCLLTWILHELRHRSLRYNSLGTKLFRTISKQLSSLCACFLIHFMRLQETNYHDGSPRQIKLHSLYSFIMFRRIP